MDEKLLNELKESIINYDTDKAVKLAEMVLEKGYNAMEAIEKGLAPGMDIIGEKYQSGDIFLPELVLAGKTMQEATNVLKKSFVEGEKSRNVLGKVVLGTVEGDIHDIGKTIVASLLSASGFEVYDIGVDVKAEEFIKKAQEINADIIGASSLLSTTVPRQKELIDLLKEKGLKDKFKVIIGGAITNQDWANKIGADGYGENAVEACVVCKSLVSG